MPCSIFIYIWPAEDDGRRWIGVINSHNHSKPAPHKICTKVQEGIQESARKSIRSTAKDLAKGLGMPYVPGEKSIAAINIDRVRRERRLALGSIVNSGGQSNASAAIINFPNITNKVEGTQDEEEELLSNKVNEMMGSYQMEGREYIFTSTYKHAFFMAPFQAKQLARASYIFVDTTYTGNTSFLYLLNVVSLNEKTLLYNGVGRVL